MTRDDGIEVVYNGYETTLHTENKVVEDDENTGYKYSGEIEFDGTNYLNTGICLYSEENIHRNFEISFNIVSLESGNSSHDTLVSSMDESKDPYPGHNIKMWPDANKNLVPTIQTNTNTNDSGPSDAIIPDTVTNVKLIRIADKLYYSFDGKECVKLNDYTGFNKFFDIPLTFGAALKNNIPYRYFKGTLSDMSLRFIDDNISIEEYNPKKKPLKNVYKHEEPYVFDGQSDYINTGLYMFTNKNIDKDFEVSFKIDSIEDEYDFTSFQNYHSVPMTIGASLRGDTGEPMRFFHGTLSNIIVKVEEE